MAVEVVTTEFGTRIVALRGGGSIMLEKHESEMVSITLDDRAGCTKVQLTQSELLTLVEYLAVAGRKGTGRELAEMPAELPATILVCEIIHTATDGETIEQTVCGKPAVGVHEHTVYVCADCKAGLEEEGFAISMLVGKP